MVEREDASIAALINTIDLERRMEPTCIVDGHVYGLNKKSGHFRDDCDPGTDGALLVGNGRSADAQEVPTCHGAKLLCHDLSTIASTNKFLLFTLFSSEE
jgi:hypothetical protein